MDDPDRLEILESAFARLSAAHRQLLWWACVDGLSYPEIAARLGITQKKLERLMAAMLRCWYEALDRERVVDVRRP